MSDNDFIPIGFDIKEFDSSDDTNSITEEEIQLDINGFPLQLSYNYLLDKAVIQLKEMKESDKKSKIPLEVRKDGAKKISFNLVEISQLLNRSQEHLSKYVMNELSTTGSLNQEGRLLLKGKFSKKQIQDVLSNYVDQYVVCKSCFKRENTEITKENRMYFLKCNNCDALRYVGMIVEGYSFKR